MGKNKSVVVKLVVENHSVESSALSAKDLKRLHNRPKPALVRMIARGTLVREKLKAKEMRRRGLTGK